MAVVSNDESVTMSVDTGVRPGRGDRERAAERRLRSLDLRIDGYSYRRIGRDLGISEAQAFRDVQRALSVLAEREAALAGRLRQMEIERLYVAYAAIAPRVRDGDLAAIDRWIRISERLARLLGLDAPARADITTGGNAMVIEYVNDWRSAPTLPTSGPDSGAEAIAALQHSQRGPALEKDHNGNGHRH